MLAQSCAKLVIYSSCQALFPVKTAVQPGFTGYGVPEQGLLYLRFLSHSINSFAGQLFNLLLPVLPIPGWFRDNAPFLRSFQSRFQQ